MKPIFIFSLMFMLGMASAIDVTVVTTNGDTKAVSLPAKGSVYLELLKATDALPKPGVGHIIRFAIGPEILDERKMIENMIDLGGQEITMVKTKNERLILPFMSNSNWTIVLEGNLPLIRIPIDGMHLTLTNHISSVQEYIFGIKSKTDPNIKMQDTLNFRDLFLTDARCQMRLETAVSYHLDAARLIHELETGFVEYTLLPTGSLDDIKPTHSFEVINDLENPVFRAVKDFRRSILNGLHSVLLLLEENQDHTIIQESIDGQELESLGIGSMSYIPQAWELTETNYYPEHPLFHGNLMSN